MVIRSRPANVRPVSHRRQTQEPGQPLSRSRCRQQADQVAVYGQRQVPRQVEEDLRGGQMSLQGRTRLYLCLNLVTVYWVLDEVYSRSNSLDRIDPIAESGRSPLSHMSYMFVQQRSQLGIGIQFYITIIIDTVFISFTGNYASFDSECSKSVSHSFRTQALKYFY